MQVSYALWFLLKERGYQSVLQQTLLHGKVPNAFCIANVPPNFGLLAQNVSDLGIYMYCHQKCTTVYGDGDYIG